jgi:hypothetical protein
VYPQKHVGLCSVEIVHLWLGSKPATLQLSMHRITLQLAALCLLGVAFARAGYTGCGGSGCNTGEDYYSLNHIPFSVPTVILADGTRLSFPGGSVLNFWLGGVCNATTPIPELLFKTYATQRVLTYCTVSNFDQLTKYFGEGSTITLSFCSWTNSTCGSSVTVPFNMRVTGLRLTIYGKHDGFIDSTIVLAGSALQLLLTPVNAAPSPLLNIDIELVEVSTPIL